MEIKTRLCVSKKIDNNLIEKRKSKVTLKLNKPEYLRMSILDLSKVFLFEFHYDYIKNEYGKNLRSLFADTDSLLYSLLYKIKTKDVYEDFSKNKEMFDFSNYSSESKYYDVQTNQLLVK